MKYEVVIVEDARRDIFTAHAWYLEQSIKAADSFAKSVSSSIQRIAKNPYQTQIRYGQIRIAFLKRFPFGIHYTVEEKSIMILAVFHTSRKPKRWPE